MFYLLYVYVFEGPMGLLFSEGRKEQGSAPLSRTSRGTVAFHDKFCRTASTTVKKETEGSLTQYKNQKVRHPWFY